MMAPTKNTDFDHAYHSLLHWVWSDIRIPAEIKALIRQGNPRSALELGCGVGRFTRYVAKQGVRVTGVDFSSVAIAKARKRAAQDARQPEFLVGDVTNLNALTGLFDVSFDIGCFHCLNPQGQQAYVAEVSRLLKPGGRHLIWAMDSPPSDIPLSPEVVREIFAPLFILQDARASRRRFAHSHWFWLVAQ